MLQSHPLLRAGGTACLKKNILSGIQHKPLWQQELLLSYCSLTAGPVGCLLTVLSVQKDMFWGLFHMCLAVDQGMSHCSPKAHVVVLLISEKTAVIATGLLDAAPIYLPPLDLVLSFCILVGRLSGCMMDAGLGHSCSCQRNEYCKFACFLMAPR